jgi:hypothetical protein
LSNIGKTYFVVDSTKVTTTYADGTAFTGTLVEDTVCLTNSAASCATRLQFYSLVEGKNMRSWDEGIVGMASGFDGDTTVKYVPQLFAKGIIKASVFSIALPSSTATPSYIDFGTVNTSAITSTNDLVYMKIPKDTSAVKYDYWWTLQITGIIYGDDLTTEYVATSYPGITDSGSTCMYIPLTYYKQIKA